jgi:putative glutamine amidotransferase
MNPQLQRPPEASMSLNTPTPLIGLPCDTRSLDGQVFHVVGDKYARAAEGGAHGIPMLIPSFTDLHDIPDLVGRLDGLMLTGSPSNVHPSRYARQATPEAEPYDEARDATTLPLLECALEEGLPLLAICRGFQELNVVLGGTLHPRVHELPGRMDHRRPQSDDPDVQYGPRHGMRFIEGGAFAAIAGRTGIEVNSLHWQAIDRLADRLAAEGVAPDGTIEAVSVRGARGFALGVQWHPEYKVLDDPFSTRLFAAFADACRERARARKRASAA